MRTPSADAAEKRGTASAGAHFHALLARLGRDTADAAPAYEALRQRLVLFFRLHVPAEAEALADTVLDRLARRIDEGIAVDNVRLYALGIAHHVLAEARSRQRQRDRALADPTFVESEPESADCVDPALLSALRRCLKRLGDEDSALILAYYDGDGALRIAQRRSLAAARGVSLNALRNRALRVRAQLESCMRLRLAAGDGQAA